MTRMESLYDMTEQILLHVNKKYKTKDERSQIIADVNELLEKREQLIKKIHSPYTEKEKKLGYKVVKLDEQIKHKMEQHLAEIQRDLINVKHKKNSEMSYINPYKNIETVDG